MNKTCFQLQIVLEASTGLLYCQKYTWEENFTDEKNHLHRPFRVSLFFLMDQDNEGLAVPIP